MGAIGNLDFGGAMDQRGIPCDVTPEEAARLKELEAQLAAILSEMDKIKPVKIYDMESEYVYNFVGVKPSRLYTYIYVSGEYDNLPPHAANPLKNGRGRPYIPYEGELFTVLDE